MLRIIWIFSFVKFLTPASGLQGYWDPYPIDMEFRPPCMVLSTIGISKPGKLEGQSTKQCTTHLHQLHVCLPSSRNKTRLLYRMSLDFAPVLKHIPFMNFLWRHFAEQVIKSFVTWFFAMSSEVEPNKTLLIKIFSLKTHLKICCIQIDTGFEWGSKACPWPTRTHEQGGKCLELAGDIRQARSEVQAMERCLGTRRETTSL